MRRREILGFGIGAGTLLAAGSGHGKSRRRRSRRKGDERRRNDRRDDDNRRHEENRRDDDNRGNDDRRRNRGNRLAAFQDPLPVPPITRTVDPFLPDFDHYPAGLYPDHAGFPSRHCKEQIWDEDAGRLRANVKFFEIVEEEVDVRLHSGLVQSTSVWRYRDNSPDAVPFDGFVGSTFKVFVNEPPSSDTPPGDALGGPVMMRVRNNLPEDHVGFGVPHTTTHMHGGHQEARSDGFPEGGNGIGFDPVIEPGQFYDYCYALRDTGFSTGNPVPAQRSSTLWYHDHFLDFTGPNVYRGLAGFFTVFDEIDADDETGARFPDTNIRLPSGRYDVPLVIADRRLDDDGNLVYLPDDHDGFLGDRMIVNGAIQPFFEVERRKYRFRILAGSNARFYLLTLEDSQTGRSRAFQQIGTDSALFTRPLETDRLLIAPAQRKQIVIDFSDYRAGDELVLVNRIDQDDGRGPDRDLDDGIDELLERSEGYTPLLQFRVVGGAVDDPSRVPAVIRPRDPIPAALLAEARRNRRHFRFERRRGAWAINGEFIDVDRPIAKPVVNRPEIWTLENGGGGWWHPIHVHLDNMIVLRRKDGRPLEDEAGDLALVETVNLGPNDEVELFVHMRDYPGSFVFHCHNLEHEDMFMMARFDLVSDDKA